MPTATTIAIIGATTAAVGTVASIQQGKKAARAGAAAAAVQKQQQQAQAARSRRAALREAQMKRAQALVQSQAVGGAGGSGVAGGLSSLNSQVGSGLGFASASTARSGLISDFGVQQQTALTKAQSASAIAGLGMQGLQLTGLPEF
jgi:hypothetical protein